MVQEVYRNRDREEIADREQVSIYTGIQGGFEISEVGSYGESCVMHRNRGGSDKMGTCLVSHKGGLEQATPATTIFVGEVYM